MSTRRGRSRSRATSEHAEGLEDVILVLENMGIEDAVSILAPKRVSNEIVEKCREIGATLGAGAAMGVF